MLLRVAFPAQVLEEEFRRIQGYRTRAPRVPRKESTPGLTKSISARVLPESIFRVYTRTRGIFRRVAHTVIAHLYTSRLYNTHYITERNSIALAWD